MLQLSGTLRNAPVRLTPISWRVSVQQSIAACSGAASPSPLLTPAKSQQEEPMPEKNGKNVNEESKLSKNTMIQAAFNTLKTIKFGPEDLKTKSTANVQSLPNSVDKKTVKQDNTSKMSQKEHQNTRRYSDKLSFFHELKEVDEAAKEVANITIEQMIKVMSALAQQKRRTTPLLRSLAFNINRSANVLNIKQSSDLLYSMAVLNYPDEVLLQKVSNDLMGCLNRVERSAVVGSVITSLGMLRYKNEDLLDKLSEWTVKNSKKMRPQDLCSFFLTLAMLGHTPTNVDALKTVLIKPLKEADMTKPTEWLDIVWALVVLQLAQDHHVASVLDSNFIQKLADPFEIPAPKKQKLLNINAAAQLIIENYKGPLLDNDSEIFAAPIQRSKEKMIFARSVINALENIFLTPKYLRTNFDIGMGFQLDAEFCINKEGKRLPIDSELEPNRGLRIVVISLCYNDFCRGKQSRLGFYDLYYCILEAKGYKVLSIPHMEFSTEDKIAERTAYIKRQIKRLAI